MDTLKENTTLDNFRVRLGILQHTFDSYFSSNLKINEFYHNIFTPIWMYDSKNEFIHVILSELDPKSYYENVHGNQEIDKYESLLDLVSNPYDKSMYVKSINEVPRKTYSSYSVEYYRFNTDSIYRKNSIYHLYKLIFWWLVVLALDNDLYNKYLDYVVDAADIFGFTEDMISDWCEAAIYWLNGNDINKDCNLKLKTKEGKRFFLNDCN